MTFVRWFEETDRSDVEEVGGKNSSLGELVQRLSGLGVQVPPGFAVTASAYRRFLGETISALPHVSNTSTYVAMEAVKETVLAEGA